MTSEDGSTLNAIGHALIQMQQGGQTTPSSQFLITRSTSSGSEFGQNGPLYVMIPPSSSAEILHAMSRPIAPKMSGISTMDYHTADSIFQMQLSGDMAANREAQRKATHNEVERERRGRINELIKVLAQIVLACQKKDATTGSIVGYVYSKGTVLDKTVWHLCKHNLCTCQLRHNYLPSYNHRCRLEPLIQTHHS
ncbi:upstream stimulatory factor 1-like isoform X1 [Halichondria panicea]|uniref:upstream stimulatory factor 1-like isoform X1 n=1 Tax=Halichondria panicea TaxID=6063 RepID=UPI00312B92B0